MRLWSLHPQYLDSKGLVAAWREALLAQKVLDGRTRGYRRHPQLERFRIQPDPVAAVARYLAGLAAEAEVRGYHFDAARIAQAGTCGRIPVTRGQILYEWEHLKGKLQKRDPQRLEQLTGIFLPDAHPLFEVVDGEIEPWERVPWAS
jgi:hypothetical protein